MHYCGQVNCPTEWAFVSSRAYSDPFSDVQMDVLFRAPEGSEHRVPAFWAGEQEWRVRFAPSQEGTYRWRTVCTDAGNTALHGVEGTLTVTPYEGENPLFRRGGLRVSANGRYLQHRDGTPVPVAGRYVVDGALPEALVPGRFSDSDRRPGTQRVHRHPDCGGAVP